MTPIAAPVAHSRSRQGAPAWRRCGIVVFAILLALGVSRTDTVAYAGSGSTANQDSDLDGLPDSFESYLNVVSSNPAWDASPMNPDCDGDGQPDGFEFCLSGRHDVFSPGVVHPVVPKLTIGSYQQGSDIVVSLYIIPGALSLIDGFKLYVAAKSPTGAHSLVDMTDQLPALLSDVSFAFWGPYQMAILTFRVPTETIRGYGSVAFAAVGHVAAEPIGDSITLAAHNGKFFRWVYTPLKSGGSSDGGSDGGSAEPQDTNGSVLGWDSNEVCGSVDTQIPTETPGVLQSVVLSIGCTTGTFACNGGICSMTGSAADDKIVLDVDLLLGL